MEITGYLTEDEGDDQFDNTNRYPPLPRSTSPTRRISILIVKNNIYDFSCDQMYHIFRNCGDVVRIVCNKYGADYRFAVYFDNEYEASYAMMILAGMKLAGQPLRFFAIVRSLGNNDLDEQVQMKMKGSLVESVDYGTF